MERSGIVSLGDVELFVREIGPEGLADVPLFVVHGGPDWDHTYLLPGIAPIALRRRVVMFDMRGCGRSSRGIGPDGYQPELVVADLERLIHTLGYDVVDLLGFSTGGQVAQLFVEANPQMVRRLVLASTTAYADVGAYEGHEHERRLEIEISRPSWVMGATAQWALDSAPTAIWDLGRLDAYLALLERVSFSEEWLGPFREGRLHPWRPADPEAVLRSFSGAVLVLHGAHDMTFPIAVARRLSAAVPSVTLCILERAGHMAHFDQPDDWSSAVLDFLDADA